MPETRPWARRAGVGLQRGAEMQPDGKWGQQGCVRQTGSKGECPFLCRVTQAPLDLKGTEVTRGPWGPR